MVTIKDIINALSFTEPHYERVSKFGAEALPHLEILVSTAQPMLAARAAFAAGLIQDEKSIDILMLAAQRNVIQVRLAAADAVYNLRVASVIRILEVLKNDEDKGVRRKALKLIELRRKGISSNKEEIN